MTTVKTCIRFLVIAFLMINMPSVAFFDNRYIPLFERTYTRTIEKPSNAYAEPFFTTADRAFDQNNNEIHIPLLEGKYDQNDLANAMVAIGLPNPLRPEWQGARLPWKIHGKIQTQGVTFAYNQAVGDWVSLGLAWYIVRADSAHEFFLELGNVSGVSLQAGDIIELDEVRRMMHTQLGLSNNQSSQVSVGDIDFYLRAGHIWEYVLKCRRVDAGLKLGVLIPAAQQRCINVPASIPLGGSGHWGFYAAVDAEFELKEDWNLGFFMRLSKRMTRTRNERMPAAGEPHIFGALSGLVEIEPGVNFVFSPYFAFENLRDGLGAKAQLTLTHHDNDYWADKRPDRTVEAKLRETNRLSEWATDYVTLNVFYDFGKLKVDRGFSPVLSLFWDIPLVYFISEQGIKAHRVSVGIEFKF